MELTLIIPSTLVAQMAVNTVNMTKLKEGIYRKQSLGYGCKNCTIGMMNRPTALKHNCDEYYERQKKKHSHSNLKDPEKGFYRQLRKKS